LSEAAQPYPYQVVAVSGWRLGIENKKGALGRLIKKLEAAK
jgi:hypothetical protein